MAEGLRLVDGCPRCGGVLVFADVVPDQVVPPDARSAPQDGLAPHLVLGVPRR